MSYDFFKEAMIEIDASAMQSLMDKTFTEAVLAKYPKANPSMVGFDVYTDNDFGAFGMDTENLDWYYDVTGIFDFSGGTAFIKSEKNLNNIEVAFSVKPIVKIVSRRK